MGKQGPCRHCGVTSELLFLNKAKMFLLVPVFPCVPQQVVILMHLGSVCVRERERERAADLEQLLLAPSPPLSEQLRRARCPSCLLPDRLLSVQAVGPIAPVFWRSRATPISPAPHQPIARSRVKLATRASGDCEQLGSCSNTIHDQFHALHDLHLHQTTSCYHQ
jgi:hypothetical protein